MYKGSMIIMIPQLSVFFFILHVSYGSDTLTVNQSLSGDQTIISKSDNFELGFFKPGNSSNYYIGIWYKKVSVRTVVWVANRETPISDRYKSKLEIVDGNLVLVNESNTQVWSTGVHSNATSLVLLDNGNLVLRYGSSLSPPAAVWQSFDHPTHTLLPGSKFGYDKRTNTTQVLTSWRSSEDPGMGLFSLEVDHTEKQYLLKWNKSVEYWTSGPWNEEKKIFTLVPEMRLNYIYKFSYIDNENESSFTYSLYNPELISRFIIGISGQIQQLSWLDNYQQWTLFWNQPREICQVYAYCGAFGVCSQESMPFCNCLTAFEPTSRSDWNLADFSAGCMRKTELNCRVKEEKPGFVVSYVPVRSVSSFLENETPASDESACRRSCLDDCSCDAFSFILETCRLWNGENLNNSSLVFVSQDSDRKTFPLYIKVSSSDIPNYTTAKISTKVLVAGIVSGFFGLVFLCSIGVILYRKFKRQGRREHNRENQELQFHERAANVKFLDPGILSAEDRKEINVPFFDFKSISSATNYFSLANKLGQGGFGPVYKGMLPGGAEIAVKRLSSQSGQGLKEFKNEVLLIAKLQHRNLVRLLGYSMKDHEMMLVYEYMPNKSLDRFIFDRTPSNMSLDWSLRFDIIMGIARGLLYLHQDSRLRIIHRDMKASNVLLDEDMNPKISDFGLAKIVRGKDTESNTSRVVGTYGYMAPEYALDGLFSVKSDVFSFGVVVLEIISGKRNTGYYNNQQSFSLISYAWGFWKNKTPLDLLDATLAESCNSIEVLRCMIVGLLCVQEYPQDRPTMTDVVLMLGMDIESLPEPKEPAFVSKSHDLSFQTSSSTSTINQLTITKEEGR
uniref:receptor-like serine/threonine-protein kinase SD1-8 n=1 Tax=Erigeron canadensis TaxID=72917 RepID=UPI001CB95B25|nr:receptor-like serine/threonine-protein kinase SD1-8 [Erigeron canadensis]